MSYGWGRSQVDPTDQNISDRPSRDLTLANMAYEVLPGLFSHPVPVRFPLVSDFADPRSWVKEVAVARRACAVRSASSPSRNVRSRSC